MSRLIESHFQHSELSIRISLQRDRLAWRLRIPLIHASALPSLDLDLSPLTSDVKTQEVQVYGM